MGPCAINKVEALIQGIFGLQTAGRKLAWDTKSGLEKRSKLVLKSAPYRHLCIRNLWSENTSVPCTWLCLTGAPLKLRASQATKPHHLTADLMLSFFLWSSSDVWSESLQKRNLHISSVHFIPIDTFRICVPSAESSSSRTQSVFSIFTVPEPSYSQAAHGRNVYWALQWHQCSDLSWYEFSEPAKHSKTWNGLKILKTWLCNFPPSVSA